MDYKVLSYKDKDVWLKYFQKLPAYFQDVYFHPEYCALYKKDNNFIECFLFEDKEGFVLYPYIRNRLPENLVSFDKDYFDIEGVYGYNAIATSSKDKKFLKKFADQFLDHCQKTNIIAEFMRFNPVTENHLLIDYMDQVVVNKNVIVDLTVSENDLWMKSYEHCVRKNVNKAKKQDIQIKFFNPSEVNDVRLNHFLEIYQETMDRNDAQEMYYFKKDFFESILEKLSDYAIFVYAFLNNKPISCELVLLGKETGYSFLGGTSAEFYTLGANNLLKHELILKLKSLGLKRYCIGGGNRIDDGISRYKKTFAKQGVVDFYIGKKIHRADIYQKICQAWEKKFPDKVQMYKNYFLKYRN